MFLGFAYAKAGQIDEAKKLLAELESLARREYVIPSSFAMIYLGLGEIDKTFDWLEKAVDELDHSMIDLHEGPYFDPLRSHPRFKTLLQKMNLQ